jgi:hypothetical protein
MICPYMDDPSAALPTTTTTTKFLELAKPYFKGKRRKSSYLYRSSNVLLPIIFATW